MTPAIVFDTETTGFPNNGAGFRARLVEVGAVVITEDARVVSQIAFLVRQPRSHLTTWQAQRAMGTHGIPVDEIVRDGLPEEDAAPRLAAWVEKVKARFGVREVRAYNQSFDFWFLERAPWSFFERTGLERGEDIQLTARRGMQLKSGPRLSRAVEFANAAGAGIPWLSSAHRAGEDARMAANIAIYFEASRGADSRPGALP